MHQELSSAHSSAETQMLLVRARALCGAGRLAWFELDLAAARAHLEEALVLFRRANDAIGTLSAISSLMLVSSWRGELDFSLRLLREGEELIPRLPERDDVLPVLANFGWAASFQTAAEVFPAARVINREVERRARTVGDERSLAWALANLGACCYWSGEYEEAVPLLERSLTSFRAMGELWGQAFVLWSLSDTERRRGNIERSLVLNEESLQNQNDNRNWVGVPYTLESFAYIAVVRGQPSRAAQLMAAARTIRESYETAVQPLVVIEHERHFALLREALSPDEFEVAWNKGAAMSMSEAIAYALDRHAE